MFKFVILANEQPGDHDLWINACEKHPADVTHRVVDLTRNSWLEEIREEHVDYLLAKPGGVTDSFKKLYDERLQILVNELGYKVFPTLKEIFIYENKRYLSFWLSANCIPHPKTGVFYNKTEAFEFIESAKYPVVAKMNIGASGNGVKIIKTREQAIKYVNRIFKNGITSRTGPRIKRGSLISRAFYNISHPNKFRNKLLLYKNISANPQRNFCIFQEFIPHVYEWRVVKIGESFFAHKKVVRGEKASGSLIKAYENPPLSLLSFVRVIAEKHKFQSMAVDVFETKKDYYLVNEMQCIFGQSDPYQMLVNGNPGRYFWSGDKWVFEEGIFNTNESYDLRMEYILKLLVSNNL